MFSMLLIKILSLAHFSMAADSPKVFSYRIKVPVSDLTCEQEALKLGQRLRELAKITDPTAHCTGNASITSNGKKYPFYILDLTFTLPKGQIENPIQSTYYGIPTFGQELNNYDGMYLDLNDCLRELPTRTAEFTNLTKKPIFAATCEKALSEFEVSYTLRIDSIGKLEMKLMATHDFGIGKVPSIWLESIQKIIEANKGTVVGHTRNYIYFYSPTIIHPSHKSYGEYQENECQTQIDNLRAILADKNPLEVTIRCVQYPLRKMKLERLEVMLNGYQFPTTTTVNETYGDLNECLQDRERILARRNQAKEPTTGALCRMTDNFNPDYDDPSYKLDIYH